MKKEMWGIFGILLFVSLGFVSAGWFDWLKPTGNVVSTPSCSLSFWDASNSWWEYKDVSSCGAYTNGYPHSLNPKYNLSTNKSDRCLVKFPVGTEGTYQWDYCPNGCLNGACIASPTPVTPNCTDSDGGLNGNVFGKVITPEITREDSCFENNGAKVTEFYCDSNNKLNGKEITCPNGCSNGACVDLNQIYITEGTPYRFISGNKSYQISISYVTQSNGLSRTKLNINGEFTTELAQGSKPYKLKDSSLITIKAVLYNSKDNGLSRVLLSFTPGNSTPIPVTRTCTDSDGGLNYNQMGIVFGDGTSYEDRCSYGRYGAYSNSTNWLFEAYCFQDKDSSAEFGYGYEYYYCPNGCSNGACINQKESSELIEENIGSYIYLQSGGEDDCDLASQNIFSSGLATKEDDCYSKFARYRLSGGDQGNDAIVVSFKKNLSSQDFYNYAKYLIPFLSYKKLEGANGGHALLGLARDTNKSFAVWYSKDKLIQVYANDFSLAEAYADKYIPNELDEQSVIKIKNLFGQETSSVNLSLIKSEVITDKDRLKDLTFIKNLNFVSLNSSEYNFIPRNSGKDDVYIGVYTVKEKIVFGDYDKFLEEEISSILKEEPKASIKKSCTEDFCQIQAVSTGGESNLTYIYWVSGSNVVVFSLDSSLLDNSNKAEEIEDLFSMYQNIYPFSKEDSSDLEEDEVEGETQDEYKFPLTIGDYSLTSYSNNNWKEECNVFDEDAINDLAEYGKNVSSLQYLNGTEICSKSNKLEYSKQKGEGLKESLHVFLLIYPKGKSISFNITRDLFLKEELLPGVYSSVDGWEMGWEAANTFDFIGVKRYYLQMEEDGGERYIPQDISIDHPVIAYFLDRYYSNPGTKEKCQLGFRINQTYCTLSSTFASQKEADLVCENNFECKSNLCINSKCVSGSLWEKILAWFKSIFG